MENKKVIEVRNLTKIYKMYNKPIDRLKESLSVMHKQYSKDFYALKNINMDVFKGETVGIIGTNGSGKSTFLKIVTGVLTPSSGTIETKGKISALLELGAGFNPEYSGVENIYLNGTMMGYTKEEIDKRVDAILDFADIGDFVYQPVKTYSSGMFVRLAFSVAINVDPDILIVDEALSVGDYKFQAKCYKKFEDFREQGKTILLVTHDVDTIKKFCNRAIWIEKGIKRMDGDTKEVTSLYIKSLYQSDASKIDKKEKNAMKREQKESIFEPIARFGKRINAIKYVALSEKYEKKQSQIFELDADIVLDIIVDVLAEDLLYDNLTIAFSIKNKKGQDILVHSLMDESVYIQRTGMHHAQFKFKNFLPSGEYYITASYEIRETVSPEYIDYIDGAYYFKVVSEKTCYGIVNLPIETTAYLE